MRDLIQQLHQSLRDGRDVAYCRLVETRGWTPQKAGALMLVFADGSQAGTLGGGCVEAEVKRRALAVLARGEPEVARFQLDSDYGWDDGLICGGRMQVLIEPLAAGRTYDYFEELGRRLDAVVEAPGVGVGRHLTGGSDGLGSQPLRRRHGDKAPRILDSTHLGSLRWSSPVSMNRGGGRR